MVKPGWWQAQEVLLLQPCQCTRQICLRQGLLSRISPLQNCTIVGYCMAFEKSGKLKGSWHYTKGCCQHFLVSTKHIKYWACRYINSKDKSGLVFREREGRGGGGVSMGHILHVKIGLLINSLKFSVNSQFTLSRRQFLTPQNPPVTYLKPK